MKKLTSILILLFISFATYGQEKIKVERESEEVKIYFGHDSHIINTDFKGNRESLYSSYDLIKELLNDTLSVITHIEINSYASPEGSPAYNRRLTEKRTEAVYDYLTHAIDVPESLIVRKSSGINWNELAELVATSEMEHKDEVQHIIRNTPEESRNNRLKNLHGGVPYRYMVENIYPHLRYGAIITLYLRKKATEIVASKPTKEIPTPEVTEVITESTATCKPPILFALKTNLLFDVATLANIELEVPVAQRWSVAGEWMFPWWLWENKQNCIQILSGNLEARYWIKPNNKYLRHTMYNPLAGWFVGLYGGGGLYDLERKTTGYQGEFYIATGVSAGYVHPFSKSLLMEFSIGLGYMNTDYRMYEAQYSNVDDRWHLIRQYNGSQTWIGPTKAKISLVWYPHFKKKGGEQ